MFRCLFEVLPVAFHEHLMTWFGEQTKVLGAAFHGARFGTAGAMQQSGTNFALEAKDSVADTNWSVVSTNPAVVGDQCRVTNQIDSPSRFFRLRRK